jgi:hypothetical protein
VLLEDCDVDACPGEQKAENHAGRAAADDSAGRALGHRDPYFSSVVEYDRRYSAERAASSAMATGQRRGPRGGGA